MIAVSVIVINYNTYALTSSCLRSVIEKTHAVTYELILVDNASSECDPQIFSQEFPQILLIRNIENIGFAKANNLGIKAASGQFVLLLNSDTVLVDDSVSILHQQMAARQQVAIASGKLISPDGTLQACCQRFPSFTLFLFEISRIQKLFSRRRVGKILLGAFFDYESEIYPDWVWGTFMMVKTSLIQKLPEQKLNEDFFMYCEDIQWCLDFKKLGYRIYYTPLAKVIHLMGGSLADKNTLRTKNFELFIENNYTFFKAWLLTRIYCSYYS